MEKPKYKKWIEREEKKGYNRSDIVATLTFFDENSTKFEQRDIYQWDAHELEEYIKEKNIASNRKKKIEKRGTYKIVHEDQNFIVVRPDDKDAAAFWGVDTKWCLTMLDAHYYDEYRDSNNAFVFVIDKKAKNQDKLGKVAILFARDKTNQIRETQYYLADDSKVGFDKLSERMQELLTDK